MMSYRNIVGGLAACLLLFVLVGCGGEPASEESSPGSSGDQKPAPSEQTSDPAGEWSNVELPRPVPEIDDELIDQGEKLYHGKLACVSCHGPAGRGDGPAASNLTNTKTGEPISPRNFQNPENFKWDSSREGIARTILTGGKNPGSPMPPMEGTVSREELWAVASYVYQFRHESSESGEE